MTQRQSKASQGAKKRPQQAPPPVSTSRFSGKDVLHVILIGVIGAAIFGGIGVAISMSKGVVAGQQSVTSQETLIAENGTPIPTIPPTATATEIPCEAQAWWDTISASTATVVNNVQNLSVQVPPQNIKAGQDASNAWKAALEAETSLSPCVQAAHQSLLNAANETGTLYGQYLSATTQIDRAKEVLKVMDNYLAVTDELQKLNITVSEDWLPKVQAFTRSECPVRRWYIEQFIVRDYQRYFTLLSSVNIAQMTPGNLQQSLLDLRTLSSSYKTDMLDTARFPTCVQTASAHYTSSIDTTIRAFNDALNGNLTTVNDLLVTAVSEKTAFLTELTTLDPALLDPKTLNL